MGNIISFIFMQTIKFSNNNFRENDQKGKHASRAERQRQKRLGKKLLCLFSNF
jgi:hypothetical protein